MASEVTPPALQARLEALETRLAFQDDWIDTLDSTLIAQQRSTFHQGRQPDGQHQRGPPGAPTEGHRQRHCPQQRQIELLERRTALLQHKLRDQHGALARMSGSDSSLDDERPPHY